MAGEPAPASELRDRWRSAVGSDVGDTVGIADFVSRQAVLALEPNDPYRRVFESNATQLWGAADNSPLTEEAVRDALSGANAADHLRAWANFWKVLATRRDVA